MPNLLLDFWCFILESSLLLNQDFMLLPFILSFPNEKISKIFRTIILFISILLLCFYSFTFLQFSFLIVFIIFIFYTLFYQWAHLSLSLLSFLVFLFNVYILFVLIYGCYSILHMGASPYYIDNFSLYKGIKYLVFITISVIIFFVFLFLRFFPNEKLQLISEKISYPYFRQEITNILKIWEDSLFGPFFDLIATKMAKSGRFKVIFFSFVFLFYYIIPLIQISFFINFSFFHGDLRYNIYLLPLSLMSYLVKNLYYYYKVFIDQNIKAIKEALIIEFIDPAYEKKMLENNIDNITSIEPNTMKIFLNPSHLEGTHFDQEQQDIILSELITGFFEYGQVATSLQLYATKTRYLSLILFILRFVCWCQICNFIFFHNNALALTGPWFTSLSRAFPKTIITRPYAMEAFKIKKIHQKAAEKESGGAYKTGHAVATDKEKVDEQDKTPVYHQLTHGKGGPNNPSLPLHPTQDASGQALPQNAVYPTTRIRFPRSYFEKKPIGGSLEFYKNSTVKANDDKNDKNYSRNEKD